MTADAIYLEQDRYAEQVSRLLAEQGLISEEDETQMKRFLRGW
jgi:hypothetical protein